MGDEGIIGILQLFLKPRRQYVKETVMVFNSTNLAVVPKEAEPLLISRRQSKSSTWNWIP